MKKVRRYARGMFGALGWMLAGVLVKHHLAAPWWAHWVPMTGALIVIAIETDKLLSCGRRWKV